MKKLLALALSAVMVLSMTACQKEEVTVPSPSDTSNGTNSGAEEINSKNSGSESSLLNIAALKGPTGMGLASLILSDEGKENYSMTLCASPTEIAPIVMQGKAQFISLPSNLGAKFSDKVSVIAINTVGNLTFVTKNMEINNISDLKGKTVVTSGKGASPEAMLNFLLEKNGLEPGKDVIIDFRAEHSECVAYLLNAESGIALLPQPFATAALTKDDSFKTALDFNGLWKEASGGVPPVMGIMTVSNEFLNENKEKVDEFLKYYEESMNMASSSDEKAVSAIAELEISPLPLARAALPFCGIEFIKGEEMKNILSSYLEVLNSFEPKLIGGKMPPESFYYLG